MTAIGVTPRLTAARNAHLGEHHRCFGPRPELAVGVLADLLHDAGLTGRGGAGFPTGRKLAAVRGPGAVVIGNGAEGEPLSGKDAWLLAHAPHLVLDGLHLAAADVSARDTFLYVPARSIAEVRNALGERNEMGCAERVQLVVAPDTFVAGEKSAVVNRVQGRRALPSDRGVSASIHGVRRRPTLVSNVETLAHMALVARFGAQWFRTVGDPVDPGTMLVSASGALIAGVVEIPTGTTLTEVLHHTGQSRRPHVPPVLLGGYHGRWVPPAEFDSVRLGRGSGTGIVHALARDECGLVRTANIVDYLAQQSAGQCGPCTNGLPRLAALMRSLVNGDHTAQAISEVARILALVERRGACHHPDGTVRLVRSALAVFHADITSHGLGRCLVATATGQSA